MTETLKQRIEILLENALGRQAQLEDHIMKNLEVNNFLYAAKYKAEKGMIDLFILNLQDALKP